jgi:2-isopropylmalate synthase
MSPQHFKKYKVYQSVDLPDRQWPNRRITQAPIWCSVDLRDGNQALSSPMNIEQKIAMFKLLVEIGFKEVEVGFPSAAQVEFDFVRTLIENNLIPDDVTIQVLTQAREHLIIRSMESLKGAKRAVMHMYNSTSPAQREVVFVKTKDEIKAIAVEGTRLVKSLAAQMSDTEIRYEYTPESFTATELEYALEISQAVIDTWQPTKDKPIIINLPSTVELSTPNIYADRIEWFGRHIKPREAVIISVHTHNDRGCAVAAAELAVMGGAERVEGALFGNGERSGNMDLLTMALNLYTQGVDCKLNLSNIQHIAEVYQQCTGMDIHQRHPWVGELVYTAFSGSHQDAIHKGLKHHTDHPCEYWDVPYIPIEPSDIGRTYEGVIRINSQSGKGGVSYILEKEAGIQIPKWMQPDFGRVVQKISDSAGRELKSQEIQDAFDRTYLLNGNLIKKYQIVSGSNKTSLDIEVIIGGRPIVFKAEGNGPVDAFIAGVAQAAGLHVAVTNYAEHALTQGADAQAIAFVEVNANGRVVYGAGRDANISAASIKAVVSAINRL